ncbi:uncharacterized protein TrAFT101_006430 [Trichoderma asperellum]|uniref:uncharacterized protein n=1 Tax=Trichoderma asperellum TaxID=101201 RepID=UPI0033199726|nr:hypothetical protein TrAFT101_006430 [Trichoderma asperellum]
MAQSTSFKSSASILLWDENLSLTNVPRLTPATVKMHLPELHATITSHYAMIYLPTKNGSEKAGNAEFTFSGDLKSENFEGLSGSFITRGIGTFDASCYRVEGKFDIIPGAGTGELGRLFTSGGSGSFKSDDKEPTKIHYEFKVSLP